MQRPAALDRVAEFAADRHRLPEQIGQPGRLGVLGDLAPAFERDVEKPSPTLGIVIILVGEDGELRADAAGAELGRDVGEGLEPIDIVAAHVGVGMAEMVEPAIWAGHSRCDAHARPVQRRTEQSHELGDRRRRPARIDEFMRQLNVPDADVVGDRVDQIVRIGKAIDQRVGVEGQRKGQDRNSCSGLPGIALDGTIIQTATIEAERRHCNVAALLRLSSWRYFSASQFSSSAFCSRLR